jgi:uncharacterized protein (DUF342 family)
MFVHAGECICSISMRGETVGGKSSAMLEKMALFTHGDDIVRRMVPGAIEFEARGEGYLFFDGDGHMRLVDPVQINPTRTKMILQLVPLNHGREACIDRIFRAVDEVDTAAGKREAERVTLEEIATMVKADRLEKRLIRKGVDPQEGANGTVILLIGKTIDKIDLSEQAVDYKEISPFQEIKKGTEIARKTPAKEGVSGKDIYGRMIAMPRVSEAVFRIGDHISERSDEEGIVYVADIDGVLTLRDDFANIDEVFKIAGDVSIETGNIRYSKDIIVYGGVCTGFTVECGGNLVIRGGIEDGAAVACKGQLTVAKGIFGQRTAVSVGAGARIGFIQNSRVRVEGDLEIRDYIYQSEVFCKGVLRVHGKEVIEKNKGCIIGGRVNSMRSMHLHSAGSEFAKTELICGIDIRAFEKLRQLEQVVPILNQKIGRLRNQVDFDISDKSVLDNMKKLPPARRESIKKILVELKEALALSVEARKKIAQMSERVYGTEDKDAVIEIQKGVIPPIFIRVKNQRFQITKASRQLKATLQGGDLVCECKA